MAKEQFALQGRQANEMAITAWTVRIIFADNIFESVSLGVSGKGRFIPVRIRNQGIDPITNLCQVLWSFQFEMNDWLSHRPGYPRSGQ